MPAVRAWRWFDFALAVGALGYGLYTLSYIWLLGGLLGFVLALLNPAARFRNWIFQRMRRSERKTFAPVVGYPPPPAEPYTRRFR